MNGLGSAGAGDLLWRSAPLIFIFTEVIVSFRQTPRLYRSDMTFAALGTSLLQDFVTVLTLPYLFSAYDWVYSNSSLPHFSSHAAGTWTLGFALFTFLDYWLHRFEHRWPLLWRLHAVHHQGEDYNALLALRNSPVLGLVGWPIVLFMAWIGIPVAVTASITGIAAGYTLLIHTSLIDRFAIFEKWLTSPTDHRVHHGTNARYLGKNYGTVFIIWDRLFGTYEKQSEAPVFGTLPRVRTHNPFLANLRPWFERAPVFRQIDEASCDSPLASTLKWHALFQLTCAFLVFSQPLELKTLFRPPLYWGHLAWILLTLASSTALFSRSRLATALSLLTAAGGVFLCLAMPKQWGNIFTLLLIVSATASFAACALRRPLLNYSNSNFASNH